MEPSAEIIIVGGGGAGLTAAIYTARARLSTLVFEKLAPGGQIAQTDLVENYPGFPEGILGPDISVRIAQQAERYGARIMYQEIRSLGRSGDLFEARTSSDVYTAHALILACGASFRTLGVAGEKELVGKGVSYCATCDGAFFRDKKIAVVGGGDSALQEGLFLMRFAREVTIIHRRDELRASLILQDRARSNPKIKFLWNTVVKRIEGPDKVRALTLENVQNKQTAAFETEGVFIFIGHDPNTSLLKGFVELDAHGYVRTDGGVGTSIPGVFAAGELRAGSTRQLVSACGEGCEAALAAQAYLDSRGLD